MTSHHHHADALFGVNLSTTASEDFDPVQIALEAESLGFDLVSCTDHPCGAHASNETWTLLCWVAARTTKIGIAPRVLAVPFRDPVLVAKMAETLDRIAGHRLVLGLGAGGMDDEAVALGGDRLAPAQKIDRLGEAVRLIRKTWSEDGFDFRGRWYHTEATTVTPKPASPVPLWLGTFGPAGLRLTGQLADGWIPSLGYADEDQLAPMAAAVTTAAIDAGRDPASIRFVLNAAVRMGSVPDDPDVLGGTPEAVVTRLQRFADMRFTGFNFIAPDEDAPAQHRLLAREVLPPVRAYVETLGRAPASV